MIVKYCVCASFLVFNCNPECTKDICSPATVEAQPSILTEFTRNFTWDIKAPKKTVVSLDILGEGLVETSQPCPDGFQYLVTVSKTNGKGQTEYCRGGSVTQLDLANQSVVSLRVEPKALVDHVLFKASAGPLSKTKITEDKLVLTSSTVDFGLSCHSCSLIKERRSTTLSKKLISAVQRQFIVMTMHLSHYLH